MAEKVGGAEGVLKIIDHVNELLERVNSLTGADVLVGIPKENNARKDSPIGNAQLARIHEFGSPARNIPARPFMYPGVKAIRREAIDLLVEGATKVLKDGGEIDTTLHKVGMLARNSVVRAITDPNPPFVPLKPATIRARLRRTAAGRRKLRDLGKIKAAAGWSGAQSGQALAMWAESGNIKPLLDTTQMRAAITYVVREGGE